MSRAARLAVVLVLALATSVAARQGFTPRLKLPYTDHDATNLILDKLDEIAIAADPVTGAITLPALTLSFPPGTNLSILQNATTIVDVLRAATLHVGPYFNGSGALNIQTGGVSGPGALIRQAFGAANPLIQLELFPSDPWLRWDPVAPQVLVGLQPTDVAGNAVDSKTLTFTGTKGGNTTGSTGQFGGNGSGFVFTGGPGGNAPVGSTNGTGGSITFAPGAPGSGGGSPGFQGSVIFQNTGGKIVADGSLILPGQIVTITADNQVVTPPRGTLLLSSNDTTAANRTFTLATTGESGQVLFLIWTHETNKGELVSSGTTKLAGGATWPPATNQQFDTLTLVSDGTNWLEVARAAN